MKKWIAVCGGPLYSGLNALLYIAVTFTTHRNEAIVHVSFSFLKVFKENTYYGFFHTSFCLYTQNISLLSHYIITVISILCNFLKLYSHVLSHFT